MYTFEHAFILVNKIYPNVSIDEKILMSQFIMKEMEKRLMAVRYIFDSISFSILREEFPPGNIKQ